MQGKSNNCKFGIAYINLVIYGDDPTSTTIDEGISGTEDFYLKIYDYSNGIYIDFPQVIM